MGLHVGVIIDKMEQVVIYSSLYPKLYGMRYWGWSIIVHWLDIWSIRKHLGYKKTTPKLLQWIYWHQVHEDVKLWVAQCDICQSTKPSTKKSKAPLGRMTAGAPLDRLCTDILGPLPTTPRGNKFVLVVTDSFTKWTEVFAVPDETAETCARVILNEVICRFGCPLAIHSDQGRSYESNIFKEFCQLLEIHITHTSPKNPKCNGQTERFNRTLLPMIRAFIQGQQKQWDLYLGCIRGLPSNTSWIYNSYTKYDDVR